MLAPPTYAGEESRELSNPSHFMWRISITSVVMWSSMNNIWNNNSMVTWASIGTNKAVLSTLIAPHHVISAVLTCLTCSLEVFNHGRQLQHRLLPDQSEETSWPLTKLSISFICFSQKQYSLDNLLLSGQPRLSLTQYCAIFAAIVKNHTTRSCNTAI